MAGIPAACAPSITTAPTMSDPILQVFPVHGRSLEDLCADPHPHADSSGRLTLADGTAPPPALETLVSAFWSQSSLYVLFTGRFVNLRAKFSGVPGRTPRLWELSDVFELFLGRDSAQTGHYLEFQVAPDGSWFAAEVRNQGGQVLADHAKETSFRCLSAVDKPAGIWKAGMEIPWRDLGGMDENGPWQGNFYRATGKFHGDELMAWSPTGYGERCFHRPERFGTLRIHKG